MDKKMTLGDMVALDIIKRPLIPSKEHRLSRLGTALALDAMDKYSPLELFANGEQGVWYDPSDESTLFQDAAGTIPVVNDGDPVGLMLDKSQGLELGPELVTNGDFSDGLSGWVNGAAPWEVFTNQSGKLRLTNTTGATQFGSTTDTVSLVSGKSYVFTADLNKLSGVDFWDITLREVAGGVVRHTITVTFSTGKLRAQFVATTTETVVIQFTGRNTFDGTADNISVRELKGNHATQSTSAARPTYRRGDSRGVVNLLKWSEAFDNVFWNTLGATIIPNSATAPDGEMTMDLLVESTSGGTHLIQRNAATTVGAVQTVSWFVKAAGRYRVRSADAGANSSIYDLSTGTVVSQGAGSTATISHIGNDIYRITDTRSWQYVTPYLLLDNGTTISYTGNGTSGIYIWGAQLNPGSTATPYQRNDSRLGGVATGNDSDLRWLEGDGVDDFMDTGYKISTVDNTLAVSSNIESNSAIILGTQNGSGRAYIGRYGNKITTGWGNLSWADIQGSIFKDPTIAIVSGDDSKVSLYDGGINTSNKTVTESPNTTNSIYVMANNSGSSTLHAKGKLYSAIVLSRLLTSDERKDLEYYLAAQSGAKLPVLTPPLNIGHTYE